MTLNRTTSLILFGLIVTIGIVLIVTQRHRETVDITVDQRVDTRSLPEEVFVGTDLIPGIYAINTTQSSIEWTARKKMIPSYIDVGNLKPDHGMFIIDDSQNIIEGEIMVDIRSLEVTETGVGGGFSGLARDLLSDRFFDAESFPEATFVVTSVESRRKNSFEVIGDLMIKGVTQQVIFMAHIEPISAQSVVLSGELTIDRTSYGITFGSDRFFDDLGDRVIDDMVDLTISLQATRVE